MKAGERAALYLLCVLNVGFIFQQIGILPTGQWQSLRTKNLEVVDDKGRIIAALGSTGDYGGKLILRGYVDNVQKKRSMIYLSTFKDMSTLSMHGYNSQAEAVFGGAMITVSESVGGGTISAFGVTSGYEGNPLVSIGPMQGYDLEPGQFIQIKDEEDNYFAPEVKFWKTAKEVKKEWEDAGLIKRDNKDD